MKTSLIATSLLLGVAGCASGPSGGPTQPAVNAPNRLTLSLTTAQALGQTANSRGFYYAFAFDDDDNSQTGPQAIVSSSDSPNGLVTGSSRDSNDASQGFTVLVIYRAGQFNVFRRTAQPNAQEQLEPFPSAFIRQGNTPSASGRQITFVLNLDAFNTRGDGTRSYLFRHDSAGKLAVQRLDTNVVTTNEIIRGSQNNLVKPFDAFGRNDGSNRGVGLRANVYQTFDIRSTRTGGAAYTEQDIRPIPEPGGDVFNADGSLPDANERGSLDITGFRLEVRRG